MRASIVVLTLGLSLLTGCSGDDQGGDADGGDAALASSQQEVAEAWQAEAADALGSDDVDFEGLQQQAAVDCQRTELSDWIVTLGTSGDLSTSDVTEIGLTHACPDVAKTFDEASAAIEDAADPIKLVCSQPKDALGSEEALKADFLC